MTLSVTHLFDGNVTSIYVDIHIKELQSAQDEYAVTHFVVKKLRAAGVPVRVGPNNEIRLLPEYVILDMNRPESGVNIGKGVLMRDNNHSTRTIHFKYTPPTPHHIKHVPETRYYNGDGLDIIDIDAREVVELKRLK